jgi:hypothetical protein
MKSQNTFPIITDVTQRGEAATKSTNQINRVHSQIRGCGLKNNPSSKPLMATKTQHDRPMLINSQKWPHDRHIQQAGGLPELSRWLREALRAPPPDIIADKNRIPKGCQNKQGQK